MVGYIAAPTVPMVERQTEALTTADAARVLAVSVSTVRRLVRERAALSGGPRVGQQAAEPCGCRALGTAALGGWTAAGESLPPGPTARLTGTAHRLLGPGLIQPFRRHSWSRSNSKGSTSMTAASRSTERKVRFRSPRSKPPM